MSRDEHEYWREERTWAPPRGGELVIQDDLAAAAWIEPLLVPWSFEVQMMTPRGFEAYARIFFPFPGPGAVSHGGTAGRGFTSWTEMARRNGRTAHALMEAETILAGPAGGRPPGGGAGSLTGEQFDDLLPVLARHTSAADSWFLLWEGFGDLNPRAFAEHRRRVRHSMRNYYLLRGPHRCYADFPHNPNYWWPADRAWCVVTDTDFDWAYVAGSAACVQEILAVPVLDAYPTRPDNPARSGMDVINDPGTVVPRMP